MAKTKSELSPMMIQYNAAKAEHPDKILLFRLGDFYEMFNKDAHIVHEVLGLTLTQRFKGEKAMPMAGVPVHTVEGYILKLIQAGHRVAICDQVEEASAAKGIVKRAVTRVITPGTLNEESFLSSGKNNFLAAAVSHDERSGLAYIDISTGEFYITELDAQALQTEIERLNPAEFLVKDSLICDENPPDYVGRRSSQTSRPEWEFDKQDALETLQRHFGVETLEGFGLNKDNLAIGAAGAIIHYLLETQSTQIGHITPPVVLPEGTSMVVDKRTFANLEIFNSNDETQNASLVSVLDKTRTASGERMLRDWLSRPLVDIPAINARQDAVAELHSDAFLREEITECLSGVKDLERLCAKLSAKRANPRDILHLQETLLRIPQVKRIITRATSANIKECENNLKEETLLVETLCKTLSEDPPTNTNDGGVIKDGVDEELDRLRNIRTGGKEWIAAFQATESERTGIPKLKVGFNRVFGYYIEVTRSKLSCVPENYIRKQTLTNAERFITPELKEREAEVLGAEDKIIRLELQLFNEMCAVAAECIVSIQKTARALATIDVYCSFAKVADENRYTRPNITDGYEINIEQSRHPVVENLLPSGEFVANDIKLNRDEKQILIVTGPNMSGKSTYIRQAAMLILLAQTGSFIPAEKAKIGIVDKMFSRVGAGDNLARGQSTFMVEMVETANILNNATARSFIVLDEVGRGTSTYDGVAIAWAVTEYLHDNPHVRARTLFATHYHELTAMSADHPHISNINVAVREWEGEITFMHHIIEGGADKSYGIHVARIAGIPRGIIERAKEILARLESSDVSLDGHAYFAPSQSQNKQATRQQLSLFETDVDKCHELATTITNIDIQNMTPLQALTRLNELTHEATKIIQSEKIK